MLYANMDKDRKEALLNIIKIGTSAGVEGRRTQGSRERDTGEQGAEHGLKRFPRPQQMFAAGGAKSCGGCAKSLWRPPKNLDFLGKDYSFSGK